MGADKAVFNEDQAYRNSMNNSSEIKHNSTDVIRTVEWNTD